MAKSEFGLAFKKACEVRSVSLNQLAERMMQQGAPGKGDAGHLSRLQRGQHTPSEDKVVQIAKGLSSIAGDSETAKDKLLSQLMSAAGFNITDDDQIEYLKQKCALRLEEAGLNLRQVTDILEQISISTIKRLADDNEPLEIVELENISKELVAKAERHMQGLRGNSNPSQTADHTIVAGRARILIDGELSGSQERLIRDAANMIKSVLET